MRNSIRKITFTNYKFKIMGITFSLSNLSKDDIAEITGTISKQQSY